MGGQLVTGGLLLHGTWPQANSSTRFVAIRIGRRCYDPVRHGTEVGATAKAGHRARARASRSCNSHAETTDSLLVPHPRTMKLTWNTNTLSLGTPTHILTAVVAPGMPLHGTASSVSTRRAGAHGPAVGGCRRCCRRCRPSGTVPRTSWAPAPPAGRRTPAAADC